MLPDAAPALPESWESVCQWVMGGRIALWDEVFEKVFLQVWHDHDYHYDDSLCTLFTSMLRQEGMKINVALQWTAYQGCILKV